MARRLRTQIRARKPDADASCASPGFPLKPVQPRPAVFSAHAGTRISILDPGSVGPSRDALVGALRESCFAATRTVILESLLRGRGRTRAVASGATGILLEIAPLGPDRNRLHRRVPARILPGLSDSRIRTACAGSPPEPSLAAIRRTRGPQTEPVQGGPAHRVLTCPVRLPRGLREAFEAGGRSSGGRSVSRSSRPSGGRGERSSGRGRSRAFSSSPSRHRSSGASRTSTPRSYLPGAPSSGSSRGFRGGGTFLRWDAAFPVPQGRPAAGASVAAAEAAPGRSARLLRDTAARARAGPAHRVLTCPVRLPRGLREAFEAGDVPPVDAAFPVPQGRPAAGASVAAAEAAPGRSARLLRDTAARARAGPAHRVLTCPVRLPRGLREAFEAGDVPPVDAAFPVPQGRPAAGAGVAAAEAAHEAVEAGDADAARISDSSASGVP